jgi:uncharacterized Zn-finger protein
MVTALIPVCNKVFSWQHINTYMVVTVCILVCNKALIDKRSLVTHQHIHSGEHPFSCEESFKAFSDKSYLIRRNCKHDCVHPHTCDVCYKAFSEKSTLITHWHIHSGERPYTCDVCNKAFSNKSNLMTNQRIHNIEYTNMSVCNTTVYFIYFKIIYRQGDMFRPSLGHPQALKETRSKTT